MKREVWAHTCRQAGRAYTKTEAGLRGTLPLAQGHQRQLANYQKLGKRQETDHSPRHSEGVNPVNTLTLNF